MPSLIIYEYTIIRVVPRVERGEFLNVGIIVSSQAHKFLKAKVELDEKKLLSIDPSADAAMIRSMLETIPLICQGDKGAGSVALMSIRERFDWLTAPRSSSLQTSPVHTGRCESPDDALEHLMNTMVRTLKA